MSRFFRKGDSSSSSSDAEASDDEPDPGNEVAAERFAPDTSPKQTLGAQSVARSDTTFGFGDNPRDFLLHALLEERCLTQARASHTGRHYGKDSPEVAAAARADYLRLCSQLSPLNLISTGLEHDSHSNTRQRFRDGLDILNQQSSTQSTVSPPLRRLLTEPDAVPGALLERQLEIRPAHRARFPGPLQRLLADTQLDDAISARPQSLYFAPSLGPSLDTPGNGIVGTVLESRYHRDFEELSMLGRGGFGIVYHVRHRLDRQTYAVKKIPLSRNRIQRIQARGQSELDDFLRELQTLARLEHPNIVRYYAGWIEWVDTQSQPGLISSEEDTGPRNTTQTDSCGLFSNEFSRISTQNSSHGPSVVFENSGPITNNALRDPAEELSDHDSNRLQRVETKKTVATVSDGTIETISRPDEPSASIISTAERPHFAESTLALHVQMSLHPMTLADFMSPALETDEDTAQPLSHCFHLNPSVEILLAILDGIEYLHNEGIVHRDIKPANIFLGASTASRTTRGSVNLTHCPDCQAKGHANPFTIHVRIGDFGLVTALAQEPAVADSSAMGTEIYRPPMVVSNSSPSLDIYALGIIALELLHKFETRMERQQILQQVKQGTYPLSLAARLGKSSAAKAKSCIDMMLSREDRYATIDEIRRQLIESRT